MHDIEPYYQWRDLYISSDDTKSPFYGLVNNEFSYINKVYNYYIHPQWDSFESNTLYLKVVYCDYDEGYSIIEFIGEWNDIIENDIMYLKRNIIDKMIPNGINKFILIIENVFNFHGQENDYYEEWYEDVKDEDGWICMLNTLLHVEEELLRCQIKYFVNFGKKFNDINWRKMTPVSLFENINNKINS